MKRLIVGLLALTLAAFSGHAAKADRLEDILKKGVVRIAVPLDVPPFGSQNQAREAEGFDVELAGMVAKALGVKLELQQVTGANRIPFLLTDKVDIVISVMGLTPERAKQIMFTSPYADTKLAVFGPTSADVPSADKIGSLKFTIRRSPAHMGVRMGETNLVRWLDSFIFFNTMNGELDRLHQKWLGIPMAQMPSL